MESTRHHFDSIFYLYGGIALVVALLVFGTVFYVVFRYRAREGKPRLSSRRTEAKRIEAGYVAIVAIVVAVILPLSLLAEKKVDSTGDAAEAADAVKIDVTAFRWGWRFQYPGERVQVIGEAGTNPTFAVPAGKRIAFSLHTRDIIHSFWVPEQRFKRDAIPGRINRFDLLFDETGVEQGFCAEFCGLHHTDMRFRVRVLDEAGFDGWLNANHEGSGPGSSLPGDQAGKAGS